MAFRAASPLTSAVRQLGSGRSHGRPFATTAENAQRAYNKFSVTGDMAPVYVLFGMLGIAFSVGCQTSVQQLVHSPNVSVSKKRRASMAEVDEPDDVIASADKFISRSWLRRMAYIQDDSKTVLPDPTRPNPFTTPRNAETLKTAGVQTKFH